MRLEGGVSLQLGPVERRNPTLFQSDMFRGGFNVTVLSYVFVARPKKLLRRVESHCCNRRWQCMDARGRELNPDDLTPRNALEKHVLISRSSKTPSAFAWGQEGRYVKLVIPHPNLRP